MHKKVENISRAVIIFFFLYLSLFLSCTVAYHALRVRWLSFSLCPIFPSLSVSRNISKINSKVLTKKCLYLTVIWSLIPISSNFHCVSCYIWRLSITSISWHTRRGLIREGGLFRTRCKRGGLIWGGLRGTLTKNIMIWIMEITNQSTRIIQWKPRCFKISNILQNSHTRV